MSASTSYAKALCEAARETPDYAAILDQVEAQLSSFSNLVFKNRELKIALIGPVTSVKEKISLLEEFSKKLEWHPLLKKFLILLAKKDRLPLLAEIQESFGKIRLAVEGGVEGYVVSAEQMNGEDVDSLAKAFSKRLGKKVAFRVSVDPLLLAGMKVTVNGVTYDGSLRSQLQKLRDRFVAGFSGGSA